MNDELIESGETENKQKCLNKKCFIIFFISFILIIGLAIFLFFILRGKEEEEEKCEPGYIPINGKCKLYSFMGTYRNDLIEDKIKLINETYLTYIGEMYMNNEEINKTFSYNFSSVGNHTIYFYINISSLQSLEGMFEEVKKMVSIKFSPEFNTKNIKNMDRMFSDCNSLISLDLSNFDTSSVTSMDKMFHFCRSLTSLIISSFNTSSVTNMHALFDNCVALTSIDVSNFDT